MELGVESIKLFNSKDAIEINRKIEIFKKLREQQEEMKIIEEIQEAERHKIDEWFKKVMSEVKPWTPEERAFYTKFTFKAEF